MKTNIFSSKNSILYTTIGIISLLMTACGSYQNSSYYDNDGIYDGTAVNTAERPYQSNYDDRYISNNSNNNQSNYYSDYFSSLQNGNQSTEIFTDIDSYNNYNDDIDDENLAQNYAGWGNNSGTGGGLSGIFNGAVTSQSNAIVIAGGGGASGSVQGAGISGSNGGYGGGFNQNGGDELSFMTGIYDKYLVHR